LQLSYQKYTLDFKFNAGTSRGILKQKDTYVLKITEGGELSGYGEAGPLKGLSIDDREDIPDKLDQLVEELTEIRLPQTVEDIYMLAEEKAGADFPSIRFALETAMIDLLNGGERMIFDNDFYRAEQKIPINGLVWMGHMEDMLLQITNKVDQGFDCIKMKVGSLDFDKECDILQYIRRKYFKKKILLRVDANGAFSEEEAMSKLSRMSDFNLHSIEQPIKPGNHLAMAKLCEESPIPIALDEELIGVFNKSEKKDLLEKINPPYIILKPTLLGGIAATMEWIELAKKMNIGWWMTSALESNIGLNAISQLAAELKVTSHQGLGTGQLYHNNFPSPLKIADGHIQYEGDIWDLKSLSI